MADIYLAQVETEIGAARRVVVKQILKELGRDEKFAKMLVEEAKLVAGLSHANIAGVTDLGREEDRLFIAMEYVEGYDLNQLLRNLSKRRIALPAQFALFIVREVLAGLDFAHRKRGEDGEPLGIVHRDVSPSNVLVSFEGEVKLCDFGIALAASAIADGGAPPEGGDTGDTGERSKVAGKAAYMSPEHARGDAVDARSDVFSAGIVLWELCAGRRLYKGTEDEMLRLARAAEIPPLPAGRLPEQAALQAFLDRALARDPEARFARASDALRALDDYTMQAKLMASQLRFGAFLTNHFEEDVVVARRERERAASRLRESERPTVGAAVGAPKEPAREDTEPTPPADPYPSLAEDDVHAADTLVMDREPAHAPITVPSLHAAPPARHADETRRTSAASASATTSAAPTSAAPMSAAPTSAAPTSTEGASSRIPLVLGALIMLVGLIALAIVVAIVVGS